MALGPLHDTLISLEVVAGGDEPFAPDVEREAIRTREYALQAQREFHQAAAKRVGMPAPEERKRRLIGRATEEG